MEEKRKKLIKSEVVKLFKTSKETLRHYENIGLIQPEINERQYRLYDVADMKRLRQIFLFRDLEFNLKEMQVMIQGDMPHEEAVQLLEEHQALLTHKIDHLLELQRNMDQMLELLKRDQNQVSFRLHTYPKRQFYVFNPFETPLLESLKAYYDAFAQIIQSSFYSERTLMTFFDYGKMDDFDKRDTWMGMIVSQEAYKGMAEDTQNLYVLPEGRYLSVFYRFEEDGFSDLKDIRQQIEAYRTSNHLTFGNLKILEIEHPELSMTLKPHEMIYELQIYVGSVE